MVMMDTVNLESCEKRTERINSIIALVIVIDRIPNVADKESFLPVLEKLLKSLSNYDQAKVVKGLIVEYWQLLSNGISQKTRTSS